VLVSNLGLTVFVKHQINWLNRFRTLPSGKGKKKKLKGKNLRSPFFGLLPEQKPPDALSLSFHRKHICLTGYIGEQKSTSSSIPIHASKGVLLLAMQALLVTLIEFFFLITSIQLVEENRPTFRTLPHLSRKTLEGTLSLVARGTSHPMMGLRGLPYRHL
jgi:hypothetical protein